MVSDGEIAGLVIIPQGYAQALENGESYQVSVVADESASSGTTIQSSVLSVVNRIHSAALTARLISASIEETDTDVYQSAFEDALASWKNPAITTVATETTVAVMEDDDTIENSFAHSSPGMILQFAIAGLIGAAGVVVREKETRTLQRMLTTNFPPAGVLLGHFLAMFLMIFLQVIVLMIFGQLFLDLNYLNAPLASLLLAVCTAACFGAMGLLIGALSKKEESAIVYSLVPMFIFAALGGAWVPLEFTSETVQLVGHFSPVAWGMDGFKDILIRGNGIETVWLPCLVLLGFGVLFFALGAWLFKFE